MKKAEAIVAELGLERIEHEGGFFRRIYSGPQRKGSRPICTTIYALFTREEFSAVHRLDAVEQFFFLDGDSFDVFKISNDGVGHREVLGRDPGRGETPHLVFEAGDWFGGMPIEGGICGWTLMSCVVTPGFDWEGFEIGKRESLIAMYPSYGDEIRKLTRVGG